MNIEIAEALIGWEDHDEAEFFKAVTADHIDEQSRWSTSYSQVWTDTRDGTFWKLCWSRGSTEQQDNGPEDIDFYKVVPKEVTRIEYVAVA